jgi:GTPase Era involved in 16S rRNA processing
MGYGFGDDHINKMLVQALRHDANKRLVVIANVKDDKEAVERASAVAKKLGVSEKVVKVMAGSAKTFLQRKDLDKLIQEFLPEPPKAEF